MTSLNTYFDAIKPFAKSIQEKATKFTGVIDEKLKKTQENLERQRTKVVEASESEALPRLWRPSTEHPSGQIVVIPTPVPIIPPVTSVIPVLPERSRTLLAVPEPHTISRKKFRRQRKGNDSDNETERKQQVHQCLNDIINEIIEKEDIEKCSNQFINTISTIDDFLEKTSNNTISTENHFMESINTHEENSELVESQSSARETDLSDSMNLFETSLEKSDRYENNFSIQSAEEHCSANTSESSIEQTNTGESSIEQTNTDESSIEQTNTGESSIEQTNTDESSIEQTNTDESSIEQTNTGESSIEQTNATTEITESLTSSVTDPKEDSLNTSLPLTPTVIDPSTIIALPEEPIKQEKRFSLVNRYLLPPDTIISHLSCSSTHIYICTNQKSLFYAQLPENNRPLNWSHYNLPTERIIVSHSNQTIWRIFDKCIYLSSDIIKLTPLCINWTELKFSKGENLLSISINDQYGWYIKEDGTLWLIRITDQEQGALNVACPFDLNHVVCSIDKIGVTTKEGQIIIRIGCTNDCPEGDGWIFIEHNFGPFDDFSLIPNNDVLCIIDKKHRIWIHNWSSQEKFYEVLRNDEYIIKSDNKKYLVDSSETFLCFTDCQEQLYIVTNCLTGILWSLVQKNTRLQHLIGAFPNENHVWALTTDGLLCSSNGEKLDKPRAAQYLTHASFVPPTNSPRILWSLDESCNIYIRNNLDEQSQWEQLDQSQFAWNRRLVHIVCNTVGVWAVDDRGCVHFRHGHISNSDEFSLLNPAWIPIPGEAKYHRSFAQIFCGPEEWMVYATDNKQIVYARTDIDENNHIGTSWKMIEDCSALELAISEHTLWLLTSHGRIQCRENISITDPTGTRLTTLPGRFNSIAVSTDDEQVWALYPPHHLFKLNRLTTLFEK